MTNWHESLQDKLAEIDLWAVNHVNSGLENLSERADKLITALKDKTQSKAVELQQGTQSQIKKMGQKVENLTRSVWAKRPKV